ncbi:MAG: hypothetical protein RL632_1060 [Bacteroidota bacterium]
MQRMIKRVIGLVFIFTHVFVFGQQTITALRTDEKIHIDGNFTEDAWSKAIPVKNFVQFKPHPGDSSSQQTEVRVIYDDQALYVSAICYDNPEHVSKILSQRDDFNANVDNFQVILDTYNDDQNGFSFGVSSMGVQFDSKVTAVSESVEVNMVWSSAVMRNEKGYQVEMRIPYSAIRFPKKDIQTWGINFYRQISRQREESVWSPIKPDFDNWLAQCGDLLGIQGIEPPLRLALIPYISGYANHYPLNQTGTSNWSKSINGGMDVKYGINEAFTLDMTLVPDFGQVVFDNKVLNLTPYEIQFNENRQFFTEGTELFNKSGLFYSRRIGIQSPYEVLKTNLSPDEELASAPSASQLYNATKVSGRTKSGLGIGIFNGITAEQKGMAVNVDSGLEREIVVSPLTNYNVFVLDQTLKNNSSVTLTNTNVMREGQFYDANVTGINTKLNSKDNKFYVSGRSAYSAKLFSTGVNDGYNAGVSLGKQTGNLVYNAGYFLESNTYDPNDLGFNANNNKRYLSASISYRVFKPFWKINQASVSASLSYERLYAPNVYTGTYLSINCFNNNRKFHASGISINSGLTKAYDYFEPRVAGRYFVGPTWLDFAPWISTNYQKRLAFDLGGSFSFIGRENWKNYSWNFSPRIRLSSKIFFIYNYEETLTLSEQGYAVAFGTPAYSTGNIVFGSRDRRNITNTINVLYTITNRMGITFRLRHYRSIVSYHSFFDLQDNGTLLGNTMTGLDNQGVSVYNTNYNAFTIDFVYRWVFKPGSEINVVWKNSIFSSDQAVKAAYLMNINGLFQNAPLNSLSVKVIYWLDYQSLRLKKNKKV